MDTFITIISWVGGFALFFFAALTWAFAEGAHAQTGEIGGRVLSVISGVTIIWLLWMGASSLYDVVFGAPDHIPTIKEKAHQEFIQKILFGVVWIGVMFWLFAPSKKKDTSKDLIKKEMREKLLAQANSLEEFFKLEEKYKENNKPKE